MKKIFIFAVAAAMFAACSSDELTNTQSIQQQTADDAIYFSIYTQRATTRAGLSYVMNVDKLTAEGFGIMAYYTDNEPYDPENSKPNFMYNTKVTATGTAPDYVWSYNPVMYWPNEYGQNATSDNVDRVSFFAYAPYVDVEPTTGVPFPVASTKKVTDDGISYNDFVKSLGFTTIVAPSTTEYETYKATYFAGDDTNAQNALDEIYREKFGQTKNITELSKNNASGDPIVKYVVDPNPATSVDLLWGVAADNLTDSYYQSIDAINAPAPVTPGEPFKNMVKPKNPVTGSAANSNNRLSFNMRHALSKLTIDIRCAVDDDHSNITNVLKSDQTRIYVRSIKIGGFAMKGALNLNNTTANTPNWKGYDGNTVLASGDVTFYDGRKDGKEGTETGEATGEMPNGLNPVIVENYVPIADVWGSINWLAAKTAGVTETAVNLFGVGAATTDPIFVIPTNDEISIEIEYDVETRDDALATYLSDGVTHGSLIKNKISKTSSEIFLASTTMAPGNGYTIHIILGMTSVKFDASVTPWTVSTASNVDLPDN